MTVFVIAAVVGFKSTAWIVVAGLAGHGVLDALHGNVVEMASRPATKQNNASPQSIDPLFSASRPSTVFESLLWTELRPCRRVNSARRTVALAPTFLRCLSLSRGSSASGSRCAGHPSELADVDQLIVLRQFHRDQSIIEVVHHVRRVHAAVTGEERQVLHRRRSAQGQRQHERAPHGRSFPSVRRYFITLRGS